MLQAMMTAQSTELQFLEDAVKAKMATKTPENLEKTFEEENEKELEKRNGLEDRRKVTHRNAAATANTNRRFSRSRSNSQIPRRRRNSNRRNWSSLPRPSNRSWRPRAGQGRDDRDTREEDSTARKGSDFGGANESSNNVNARSQKSSNNHRQRKPWKGRKD
jgi:hypothetical protein